VELIVIDIGGKDDFFHVLGMLEEISGVNEPIKSHARKMDPNDVKIILEKYQGAMINLIRKINNCTHREDGTRTNVIKQIDWKMVIKKPTTMSLR
jgi:hypothetical protein